MRDTIDMAREAGLEITVDPTETPWRTFVEGWEDQLKAFDALVRADERDVCAKVCEAVAMGEYDTPEFWREGVAYTCAAAIRARGNT
jgi:hypothetical protein